MGKMRLLFIDSYLSYRDDALKDRFDCIINIRIKATSSRHYTTSFSLSRSSSRRHLSNSNHHPSSSRRHPSPAAAYRPKHEKRKQKTLTKRTNSHYKFK